MCQVTADDEIYLSSNPDIIEKDTSDTMPTIRVLAMQCDVRVVGPLGEEEETEEVYTVGSQGRQDWEGRKVEGTGEFLMMVDCGGTVNITREVEQGANYNLVVVKEGEVPGAPVVLWYPVTEPNSIHIFWILPQYFVLTVGEILFSITSMEFAYSQAPASMKSVLQVHNPNSLVLTPSTRFKTYCC